MREDILDNPPCIERRVEDHMKMLRKKIEAVGLSMYGFWGWDHTFSEMEKKLVLRSIL